MKLGQRLWCRLRNDNQLLIITALGACASGGVIPFAVYRFMSGNTLAGIVDMGIVASVWTAMGYSWYTTDRARAGLVLALINTVGCLASATVLGPPGLYWMYPALLGNFLLLPRKTAGLVTAVALIFLALEGSGYSSLGQLVMFLVSASVSSLVAYVFASRTERQRRELEELATLDSLTGVYNRRAMSQELQIAVEQFQRGQGFFGLAMLDLDHFKRINDEYGHEAGDEVLIAFVGLVRRCTRKVDRCFRFGGEEFVLLLPSTDASALQAIDMSLRRRVEAELSYFGNPVTVSIGAAALRPDEDWQSWLARADAALYEAKHAGRNRTVVDDALLPSGEAEASLSQ